MAQRAWAVDAGRAPRVCDETMATRDAKKLGTLEKELCEAMDARDWLGAGRSYFIRIETYIKKNKHTARLK